MQKKYITLSADEELRLESGLKNHPSSAVRTRFHALLLSHNCQSVEEIATVLFVSRLSVYNWLAEKRNYGFAHCQRTGTTSYSLSG